MYSILLTICKNFKPLVPIDEKINAAKQMSFYVDCQQNYVFSYTTSCFSQC